MRILLFAPFAFPDSCADAVRVMTFAKLLQEAGYETEILGVTASEAKVDGTALGIKYKMMRSLPYYGIRAYKRINALKKGLSKYLANNSYDLILLSHIYYDYADVFLRYSKKTGAMLVVNAVEWYEKDNVQFQGFRGKINLIKNRIALRYVHPKMKNVIAISTLLDKHYKDRGCNTVTIPTIVDMTEYSSVASLKVKNNEKLVIAYAGSPARKDYILNAIYALPLLSREEREKIELHFYGTETKTLYGLGLSEEFLEKHSANVFCHGRIPYEDVKQKIASADFTVLLRPNKRYANAGFPTKVGESMACGTPVIANITSDLGKYIIDGETGIVCANETPEACAEGFKRALAMSTEEKNKMCKSAYEMARVAFNYESYVDEMREFLNK